MKHVPKKPDSLRVGAHTSANRWYVTVAPRVTVRTIERPNGWARFWQLLLFGWRWREIPK